MSKLSKFARVQKPRSALSPRRVLRVTAVALALLAFGVSQLALQFGLSDLRQETTRLQSQKLELRNQINRLRSSVGRLKQGDRLIEHARELGMVPYNLADVERLRVDPDLWSQYAIAQAEDEREAIAALREEQDWVAQLASRVGVEADAVAGDLAHEPSRARAAD